MFFLEEFAFFVSDDIKYNKQVCGDRNIIQNCLKASASAFVANGRRIYMQVHL